MEITPHQEFFGHGTLEIRFRYADKLIVSKPIPLEAQHKKLAFALDDRNLQLVKLCKLLWTEKTLRAKYGSPRLAKSPSTSMFG
jgi:hypothetical protein